MYEYRATIIKAYDGDTVTAVIDLGFKITFTERLRLYGINAPEMRGADKINGKKSRDYLRELILHKTVTIRTNKDKKGKYGRYIATILIDGIDINKKMVEDGYAVFKEY